MQVDRIDQIGGQLDIFSSVGSLSGLALMHCAGVSSVLNQATDHG